MSLFLGHVFCISALEVFLGCTDFNIQHELSNSTEKHYKIKVLVSFFLLGYEHQKASFF